MSCLHDLFQVGSDQPFKNPGRDKSVFVIPPIIMVADHFHPEISGQIPDDLNLMFRQSVKKFRHFFLIFDKRFQGLLHSQQRMEPFKKSHLKPPVRHTVVIIVFFNTFGALFPVKSIQIRKLHLILPSFNTIQRLISRLYDSGSDPRLKSPDTTEPVRTCKVIIRSFTDNIRRNRISISRHRKVLWYFMFQKQLHIFSWRTGKFFIIWLCSQRSRPEFFSEFFSCRS